LYLVNKWQQGDDYLRLKPTKADLPSYLACIKSTPDAGGSDEIGSAYRFFRQKLASAQDPEDPFDIALIERAISDNLSLVEITADHDDNVHRIFESLNNTGLKLSQADLVRNLIFMLLPTQGDVVYETIWLPMQQRLTPDQLEDLLYLYLIIGGQERTRRDGIYAGIEKLLEPLKGHETAVETVVRELDRRSRHLRRIVAPEHEPDRRLRAAFDRLTTWGAQVAYPILMVLLDKQERGEIGNDEVVEAVAYIESFLVRRMICAVPTNNLNRIFNALVNQLPTEKELDQGIREVLSRERSYWPNDQALRDAIATKPFYFQGRPLQRQLVLRRLEESFGSREPVDLNKSELTVEHVLPQAPTAEWLSMLAEETEPGEAPEELHKRLVHTLGNLTLTAYNTQLSNNPYERKQDLLRTSNLEMNKRIAATHRWGNREILARAAELAEQAIAIWPAPLDGLALDTGRDWSQLHQMLASLPAGAWTTYGDLAAVIGSHPVPVGTHVASVRVPNAHRVLRNDGMISPNFRWLDSADTRDVREVLLQEGVRLGPDGAADSSQRLSTGDLAHLVGLEVEDSANRPTWEDDPLAIEDSHRRFVSQVESRQGRAVTDAVQRLLDDWQSLGGRLAFGKSAETTCSLMWGRENKIPWPCNLYPSGSVEVAFKPMSTRPPFDQIRLREEFRQRLNQVHSVEIPVVKLALYPSFPLKVLTDSTAYPVLLEGLEWFVAQLQS